MGNSGNDLLSGGDGRDILMGGHGNDNINGGSGKDYVLLDGSMQDYAFAVTKQGVMVTDSTGEVDTVKNFEVFHFSDGTNYVIGRHGLVQTGDQTINSFLAASGVDQSLLGPVSTALTQQAPVQSVNPTGSNASVTGARVGSADPHPSTSLATAPTSPGTIPPITQQHNESFGGITSDQLSAIFGQALNQAGHPQGVDKVLTNAALWNAIDSTSNSPTHADTVMADLQQQLHDAFDHNAGSNLRVDELAALLHLTHHE
jgi:Ca2+-binding RTX toxin-like protein